MNKNYNDVNELKGLVTNPWVRIKETVGEYEPLYFDEFLGLRYISNFCEENLATQILFQWVR